MEAAASEDSGDIEAVVGFGRGSAAAQPAGCHCWLAQQCRSRDRERMDHQSRYRKKVRHFEDELCGHGLTFSCDRRRSLPSRDLWLTMFSESVMNATSRHQFDLIAKAVDWKWPSARFIVRGEVDEKLPQLDTVDWQLFE